MINRLEQCHISSSTALTAIKSVLYSLYLAPKSVSFVLKGFVTPSKITLSSQQTGGFVKQCSSDCSRTERDGCDQNNKQFFEIIENQAGQRGTLNSTYFEAA